LKKEIYQLTFEQEEKFWWYQARRRIILDQLDPLLKEFAGRPDLLDVGCGTGINLVSFSEKTNAFGIDASREALLFCKKRGLKKIALMDPSISKSKKNPFDRTFQIITLLDVLEHIELDEQYLASITNWMTEDGFIMLTVPAYQWLWSGEDAVSFHARRYSAQRLISVVERSGLNIQKLSFFNTILFPMQAAAIFLKKTFFPKSMNQTNVQPLPDWLNSCLERIMSFETWLLRRFNLPFGGSILCICRKKAIN
jgi:2-polyprenyl-3-methyl-5-hydroxy-6-metoxy-1,4-benzoquinol methylase